MSDRILVIGGTGNTGVAVLEALVGRGATPRALIRDPGRTLPAGVTPLVGDLDDGDALAKACENIDALYVAAPVHERAVERFGILFEAAHAAGVARIVKLSAQGADDDAPAAILRQHAAADRRLADSGIAWTLLRPNAFFQNLLAQADVIRATGAFYLPVGDAALALVDARDVGTAAANLLLDGGHDGESVTLTGPESLTYEQVASQLSEVIGKPVRYTPVPVTATEQALRDAGLPAWDAEAIAEIQGVFASGDYARPEPGLGALLGREPTAFEAFARDYRAAFGG